MEMVNQEEEKDGENKKVTLDDPVDMDDFPMRSTTVPLWDSGKLHFNPLTSFIGISVLLGLVIWCAVDPDGSKEGMVDMKTDVSEYWTWFYIGTQGFWLLFIVYIGYYYGHIKLGAPDEEPEFSDMSYFTMLFAAGVAVGLFFYGVSEPLWHSDSFHGTASYPNRFSGAGYHTMNEVDLYAMTLTYFHWGLAAWAPYLVVAVAASLGTYNFGLPLTMRSTLYPVLGEHTWGWMGDFIDGFTIITVVSGVCTSLGLGAMQLVTGMRMLNFIDETKDPDNTNAEVVTIWCVTVLATISVVSGLDVGIKLLSYLAFFLGTSLWFLVLVMDKTSFMLNLMVEGTGSYISWMPFMTMACDSFAQLGVGEGHDPNNLGAYQNWMNDWSIFYFAWWTAWASFVGLFIARISRGRTLGSLIVFTLIGPFLYIILWFSVFGGAGIRQARVAAELIDLGTMQGDAAMYLDAGSTSCYTAPDSISFTDSITGTTTNWEYTMKGINPNCILDVSDSDSAWFNVLNSFYGVGNFLSGLSLVAIAIYFITSSDSGSLVVDQLASNGRYDHHWVQRVIWATVEGSVATGLIASGGKDSLQALQAGSIIAGLPFTLILLYCCYSIVRFCDHINTAGRMLPGAKGGEELSTTVLKTQFHRFSLFEGGMNSDFKIPLLGGVFNYFEYFFSWGSINTKLIDFVPMPTNDVLYTLAKGFLPMWSYHEIETKLDPKNKAQGLTWFKTMVISLFFIGWIICWSIPKDTEQGMNAFGWLFFISQAIMIGVQRYQVRGVHNIEGHMTWDILAAIGIWPQVFCQMEMQFILVPDKQLDEEKNVDMRKRSDTEFSENERSDLIPLANVVKVV
jgi:choline-glycine betaine transporter